MTILHGDWPPERFIQAAWRYEVLRSIPPYLHQRIWIHTLSHSTLDEIVDMIGEAILLFPDRLLANIVAEVIGETK